MPNVYKSCPTALEPTAVTRPAAHSMPQSGGCRNEKNTSGHRPTPRRAALKGAQALDNDRAINCRSQNGTTNRLHAPFLGSSTTMRWASNLCVTALPEHAEPKTKDSLKEPQAATQVDIPNNFLAGRRDYISTTCHLICEDRPKGFSTPLVLVSFPRSP